MQHSPLFASQQEKHSALDLDGNVTTPFRKQRRIKEMEDLYNQPSWLNMSLFNYDPEAMFSSIPDLHTGFSHLYGDDCTLENKYDNHEDFLFEIHSNENDKKLWNISKIFSNIQLEHRIHGAHRHPCQGAHWKRKYSMDSQLFFKRKIQIRQPAIKRTLKITCPGQVSTMYISGVDTLGGLPDSDHLENRSSGDVIFTPPTSGSHDLDPSILHRRRSSCPVIFETEESRDCTSPRKSGSQEQDSASNDSSEELPPYGQKLSGKSGQFFLGSAPLKISDDTTRRSGRTLPGVTFIVDKEPAANEIPKTTSSDEEMSASDDVDNQESTSVRHRQFVRRKKTVSVREKSVKQVSFKPETSGRGYGSRTSSVSDSRPNSGRSSPIIGQDRVVGEVQAMSVARTDSSSSSLTDDDNIQERLSGRSSETSSADESNS